jgi:NSS family neurotransmitter:Na+ symporter
MMLALLGLIVVLAVHSLTLEGGRDGVSFFLLPSMEQVQKVGGLGKVIVAAMNQAFFTLSLGIGSMEIFGSYMSKEQSLANESIRVCGLDTFVAMMSGLIIFPACFAYGVEPDAGPALIFKTLPNVFVNMAGGRLWGTLFFLFMTFASFSTVIAVFENLLATCADSFGWSRRKAVIINCLFILVASMPALLGYNVLSDVRLIRGMNILDTEDFIVSNCLLPLGSLTILLFCTWSKSFGWNKFTEEANTGKGLKMKKWMRGYVTYVLPLIIIALFIIGIVTKFM